MHYVLEGDLIEKGESLGVGAFLTHAKGVVHGPHESKGGAKVLTVQQWQSRDGKFDFEPAEDAQPAASGGGVAARVGAAGSGWHGVVVDPGADGRRGRGAGGAARGRAPRG